MSDLALLSTAGIQDVQTRNFLDRLLQIWGANLLTRQDVRREATQAMAQALGGTQSIAPGEAMQAIDALADSIRNSLVQRILEEKIVLPDLQGLRSEVQAGMSAENTTRSTNDRALASAINRIWSYVGGATALIEQGTLAAVTPSSAVATKWDNVVAAVTDPNTGNVASAAILQETRAYANDNDGTLNAIWSVKTQLSSGGQTVVGGIAGGAPAGAGSPQGPTIDFGVAANRFWIGAPSGGGYDPVAEYTSNNQFPFIVVTTPVTLNGKTYPPGVYMKKVVIGQATIDSAEIKDAAIKTAHIDDAQVKTLKIDGEAVTIPRWAFQPGNSATLTLTVPAGTGGARVFIIGSIAAPNTGFRQKLWLDGVAVRDESVINGSIPCIMYSTTVSDGAHTITMDSTDAAAFNASLYVIYTSR